MKMKGAKKITTNKKVIGKIEKAKTGIEEYKALKDQYAGIEREIQETYPKAYAKIQELKKLEDDIRAHIASCKLLVRAAGQTIGPFTCTPKFTTEGYVGSKVLEILTEGDAEEAGALLKELTTRGVIKDLVIEDAAAKIIRSSDAHLSEVLESAWDAGGTPMTPAVSCPKF